MDYDRRGALWGLFVYPASWNADGLSRIRTAMLNPEVEGA